jgi:hypothetical protein
MPAVPEAVPMAADPFGAPAQLPPAPAEPISDAMAPAHGFPGGHDEVGGPAVDGVPRIGPKVSFPDVTSSEATGRQAFDPLGEVTGPKMLHIPCPKGHELETPPEMLGEDVICPHCGSQFTLKEKDSVEYKRKKKQEQEKRDIRSGKNWFAWAVVTVAIVLIGLIVMIAIGEWF